MIEINLLPKELKKKRSQFKMPDITFIFMPAAVGLVGLLILVQVLLTATIAYKSSQYKGLDKKWNKILPEKTQIDSIKGQIRGVQKKVDAIDKLIVKRTLWSRRLNDISDSMIPGIWLVKLSIDEKTVHFKAKTKYLPSRKRKASAAAGSEEKAKVVRYLNIEGCASSTYGDETATVGRFIESLKENESFFESFSEIELELIERKVIKDIELMKFRLSCYFK